MAVPNLPLVAVPGQPLASSIVYNLGTGVHIFNYEVCASIIGLPQLSTPSSSGSKQTLSVIPSLNVSGGTKENGMLPRLGDTVLAKVKRTNYMEATLGIFVVNGTVCTDEFQGVIRQQDVRAQQKDKAKINSSFRPGDIVRAQVISLGDQSRYYLSTAGNSLGVIIAHSDSGNPLHALSWREMASASTGVVEERKVAKPM